MKLRGYIVIIIALIVCGTVTPQFRSQQPQEKQRSFVDQKGGKAFSIKVGDSSAVAFVGDLIFHHNGAVITCDSAVRYSEQRFEWFGNVIINKDSTYIYGDRVDYNGNTNLARVYSPLVKMIDGDAVMYTYNLVYNTHTNVGEYFGGGTLTQNETLLESERGYYYGDTKDVICVRSVELRDSSYLIRSDSLGYNMDTEIATFFSKSYIWNEKGEILSADDGVYYTREKRYNFYSDAYILTDERELWADDIDYREDREDAILKSNIQIRDEEQKVLAFGDYGLYFGERSEAMLTDNPSVISFDHDRGDSLFLRADSLFLFVVDSMSIYHPSYKERANATKAAGEQKGDRTDRANRPAPSPEAGGIRGGIGERTDSVSMENTGIVADSLSTASAITVAGEKIDSTATAASAFIKEEITDSLSSGTVMDIGDGITGEETTEIVAGEGTIKTEDEAGSIENDSEDAEDEEDLPPPVETSGETADTATVVLNNSDIETDEDSVALAEGIAAPPVTGDSIAVAGTIPPVQSDSTGTGNTTPFPGDDPMRPMGGVEPTLKDMVISAFAEFKKNLEKMEADRMAGGITKEEGEKDEEGEEEVQRVVVGYHNVRIFRSDFQAVCDSLVGFTIDSTIHLYIQPVMWNGDNQIKSDEVTVYTVNKQIERAVFIGGAGGNPIMSARLDYKHFNQVTGKTIEAFFADNELYRTDAVGNGIAYYYMQEDETGALQGFLTVECADISFYIVNQTIDDIVCRVDPVYAIYPMTEIPASQPQRLSNFKWEGDRKPSQKDVFDRNIRESRREEYLSLPKPVFSITAKIDGHKQRITESGEWNDRKEDISQDAHEFVEMIRLQEVKTQQRP